MLRTWLVRLKYFAPKSPDAFSGMWQPAQLPGALSGQSQVRATAPVSLLLKKDAWWFSPLKKGTTSWQPAHHREALTLPSRARATARVSLMLKRYGWLLNELKWCELWNQPR